MGDFWVSCYTADDESIVELGKINKLVQVSAGNSMKALMHGKLQINAHQIEGNEVYQLMLHAMYCEKAKKAFVSFANFCRKQNKIEMRIDMEKYPWYF